MDRIRHLDMELREIERDIDEGRYSPDHVDEMEREAAYYEREIMDELRRTGRD